MSKNKVYYSSKVLYPKKLLTIIKITANLKLILFTNGGVAIEILNSAQHKFNNSGNKQGRFHLGRI